MNEQQDEGLNVTKNVSDFTLLGDEDLYLFNEGSHLSLYEKLGAHPCHVDGVADAYFAVWAPNAELVTVMGDFNDWTNEGPQLRPRAKIRHLGRFRTDCGSRVAVQVSNQFTVSRL